MVGFAHLAGTYLERDCAMQVLRHPYMHCPKRTGKEWQECLIATVV